MALRAGERPGWHRVFLPVALLYHEGKRERSREAAQIQRPALVKRRLSAFSIMIFVVLLNVIVTSFYQNGSHFKYRIISYYTRNTCLLKKAWKTWKTLENYPQSPQTPESNSSAPLCILLPFSFKQRCSHVIY